MDNIEFFTYTLPNGIRCIHKRIDSVVAYCALSVNAGSRDEHANEHGLAHFVEHCMFKGTTHRTSYDILSYVESRGGEVNAYTGKEETVLHATTLKEDIERAIDIISDIVFNATFDPQKIEQEKQVIFDEINSYMDSFPESIFDDFEDLLFKDSALGHNILGEKKILAKFTADDIRSFVSRCYTTDMMVFSLFGDVSQQEFIELCDRYFAQVPPSTRNFTRSETLPYRSFQSKMSKSESQIHYFIGNRAYGMNDDARLPATILANVLGGQSINSLLNIALREENGLTYNIESSINSYMDTGIFSIYFTSDKKRISHCLELIDREIAKMKDAEFVDQILPSAKQQFIGQFLIGTENMENYMLNAARSYMIYNSVDGVDAVKAKIMAVTTNDIISVAETMFADMSTLIYK